MIFCMALWAVTPPQSLNAGDFSVPLSCSQLFPCLLMSKDLEFQGFSPFCFWSKLREHNSSMSHNLVSCNGWAVWDLSPQRDWQILS